MNSLKLKHVVSLYSECGIRKMALEEKLQAMEKADFFWNDLQCGNPMEKAKKWRENLRGVRSQNDMNKAVPQPPLFPILDFDDDEFAIWEASRELSCDEVIPETENWEESAAVNEMYLGDFIPETENWEESASNDGNLPLKGALLYVLF